MKTDLQWKLGNNIIEPTENATHLGIIRSELKENQLNIEARLSIARRTLYSLINTGVHGSNGLNPATSYKIYQCYVLPRLLYGLEILPLNISQLEILNKFHLKNLRNFQSLPDRTASGVVYLLLGALPIEAEIHRRQMSFLHNVLSCENSTIQELTERQCIMNIDNTESFFCRVSEALSKYRLSDITNLKENLPSKDAWKNEVKIAVRKHWLQVLFDDMKGKSTLSNMNLQILKFGCTHPLWASLKNTVSDVKKGIIKARIITGTYILETNRHRFSAGKESALCKCCGLENEDIIHFLLHCPALYQQRKDIYGKIKQLIITLIGCNNWNILSSNKLFTTRIIIDCSFLKPYLLKPHDLEEVNRLTTDLCYKLHIHRLVLLNKRKDRS